MNERIVVHHLYQSHHAVAGRSIPDPHRNSKVMTKEYKSLRHTEGTVRDTIVEDINTCTGL